MAYSTGQAANYAALKTALINACTGDGWTLTGDVLSKGTMFFKCTVEANKDYYTDIPWPVTYHAFTFTNEVYFVISYGDEYQWLTFGQSQQPGLTGSGNYYSGSLAADITSRGYTVGVYGIVYLYGCPAPFVGAYGSYEWARNGYLDSGIDGEDWYLGQGLTGRGRSMGYNVRLLQTQPNNYNMESVLLPVKVFKTRSDSLYSQTFQAENSRYLRNDNYSDETIVTIGLDQWMTFPFYKRNTSARNGGTVGDSGTFGWAIKYEGP
jgi:hypothetical protein